MVSYNLSFYKYLRWLFPDLISISPINIRFVSSLITPPQGCKLFVINVSGF